MPRAFYALSADPITNGHLWVIEQASKIFGDLIVALGTNPEKRYYFTEDERMGMLRGAISHGIRGDIHHRWKDRLALGEIKVCTLDPKDFSVRVAKQLGCDFLIRGVRGLADFEFEMNLANINRTLEPSVETIFLPTPPSLATISSTVVRGMFGLEGWEKEVAKLVPPSVLESIISIRKERHGQ